MAITEESRHKLYKALEDSIGVQNASTLMEHLPPVGWADVATKRDLDHLERGIELTVHRELRHQMNVLLPCLIAGNVTLASAIIAAIKLL